MALKLRTSSDEPLIVHKCEEAHDELAVHTVRNTTVARDRVAKVLDVEGTLEARSKEPSKRRDERRECGQHEDMKLHWAVAC